MITGLATSQVSILKKKLLEKKRNRMAHQLHEYNGHNNITYNTYDNCNNYIGIRTVTQYLFSSNVFIIIN